MIEKNWFQQDFIYFRFTRGRFITFVAEVIFVWLIYSAVLYGIGRGVAKQRFKKLYWRYLWWVHYWLK
jgi:hypothetical protein